MQLRKRKRVDYSSTIEAASTKIKYNDATNNPDKPVPVRSKPKKSLVIPKVTVPSARTKKNIVIPKVTQLHAKPKISQQTPSKKKQNISKRFSEDKLLNEKMKGVTLTRPFYKSQVNYKDEQDAITTIPKLNELSKALDDLIPVQKNLYYIDLKGPKYLGPKNFETLKLPSDITNLQTISADLKQFIRYREEAHNIEDNLSRQVSKNSETSYSPIINKDRMEGIKVLSKFEDIPEFEIVDRLAQIHGINIRDIHGLRQANIKPMLDSNFVNKNEVNSISKRLDKKLQKERNNNVVWPTKTKKKKAQNKKNKAKKEIQDSKLRFSNIGLFNSV